MPPSRIPPLCAPVINKVVLDLTVDVTVLVWSEDHSPYATLTLWPRERTYCVVLSDHKFVLGKAGLSEASILEVWYKRAWQPVRWGQPLAVGQGGRGFMLRRKGVNHMFDLDAGARALGRSDVSALPDSSPLARKRTRSPSPAGPRRRMRREDSVKFGTAEYPHVLDSDDNVFH